MMKLVWFGVIPEMEARRAEAGLFQMEQFVRPKEIDMVGLVTVSTVNAR